MVLYKEEVVMRYKLLGGILALLALAVLVVYAVFLFILLKSTYVHFGLIGLMVGIALSVLLIMFLRWQENKH